MKNTASIIFIAAACILMAGSAAANTTDSLRSRRSSLCSIMIKHPSQEFAKEIEKEFLNIPIDDKFYDHNLAVRVAVSDYDKADGEDVDAFVERNKIASRLVGKWFNRNKLTGECDLNTIKYRGLYDASAADFELASKSLLGNALVEDAGEELIGHTYLLVHDITYIDKGKRSSFWGQMAGAALQVGAVAAGLDNDLAKDLGQLGNATIASIKGFRVKIESRLYRLVWDEETSGLFFSSHYWAPGMSSDPHEFDKNRSKYHLDYVGNVVSRGGTTSFLGINEDRPELMIRKACARAMEENVADLQKKYEQFRVKSPILSVSPLVTAGIGLKEGVKADSKYEVLECLVKNGKTTYKRVGVVRPMPGMIWDNRFMAAEEGTPASRLGCTTFKVESGSNFYPGLLLREI